ncbi:hypothetical protein NELON_08565 [Neisseria elongata subsp. glycolytica ATCC 29315]|uniref:Uncharacterized protein n=1 Tax=Neisseria elongata subsp. glycolytica ATCC 29315 TaxID=546263 RepID=D4DSI4_NEIEG|nr:hypothetical protein NELON_08565 [Neisseria elongata subsp. glycolytica ATCC 29315]EFE49208.1 hypothetical protein NEIELOOT_02029 [Neisseria elongata subsp. glycolytica ATCC 29315]SQH50832.1 putative tail fiber protein [Neisseria elongata subsp. glycolytica]
MHPIETPDKTFHDGDGVSELGTILPAWWLNQVQSELLAVLTAAGIRPDKSQPNQLLAALNKLAVVTTGNQDIGGSKTFTAAATFKAGAIVADSVGDFLRLMAMVRPPFVFFSSTRSELPAYLDLVAELHLPGCERFAGSQTLTVSSTINRNSSYDDHLIYKF